MPIDFLSLDRDRRTIEVEINGEPLKVTYQPSKLTATVQSTYELMRERGMQTTAVVRRLAEIVVEWDAAIDGEPLEPDHAGFGRIPLMYLNQIDQAITLDFTAAQTTTTS